jgi:quinol-cytochrome oxidoreductase complex cytochrome b subunit
MPAPEHDEKDTVPFFPDHFMTEFRVAIGIIVIFVIIGAIGMINPVGLEEPADPLNTPLHVKPEWYFLFLYQLLKLVPGTLFWGQVEGRVLITSLVIIGLIGIMFMPLFDKTEDTKRQWIIRAIISAVAVIAIIALTLWGELS